MIFLLNFLVEFDNFYSKKAFVERGATLNNISKYGDTPLILAA